MQNNKHSYWSMFFKQTQILSNNWTKINIFECMTIIGTSWKFSLKKLLIFQNRIWKRKFEKQKWYVSYITVHTTTKNYNDFEAYQVFMQIFYVKMLGYSFWSNNIKKFCFGGIKTVYTQKIIWEKLTKFRNIISTISSLHMPKNVLTLSNHIQLMHTKSVFTSYHFSATLLQLSLSTLYHFLPYFIFYKLWKI